MPSPNPAGYYSLDIPEQFETEINTLSLSNLAFLNYELADFLYDVLPAEADEEFRSTNLSGQADQWINNLQADELINLIRWITERLAYLYHKRNRVIKAV